MPRAQEVETLDEARWNAVLGRDRAADGSFVYAVASTGVYCRPSCASRRPRRERVTFFDTPRTAAAAGYRACRRCRPERAGPDPWSARIQRACALLAGADGHLPLARLARRLGGSPYHLQRNFKSIVGLTPREWAEACRLQRVKRHLRAGRSVTAALFEAGYGSNGRFYERAASRLGMPPSTYGRGGAGVTIRYAIVDSCLGRLMVASTARGVCSVALGSSDRELARVLATEYPAAVVMRDDEALAKATTAIVEHLNGHRPRIELPIDVQATAFQRQVWKAIGDIPRGETRTYREVASAVGHPRAVRAVGRACATNRVALLIPCHRVVPSSGGVGGYRWGVARKKALLARERSVPRGQG